MLVRGAAFIFSKNELFDVTEYKIKIVLLEWLALDLIIVST